MLKDIYNMYLKHAKGHTYITCTTGMLKVCVLLQEEVGGGGAGAREEEGGRGEASQGGQGRTPP